MKHLSVADEVSQSWGQRTETASFPHPFWVRPFLPAMRGALSTCWGWLWVASAVSEIDVCLSAHGNADLLLRFAVLSFSVYFFGIFDLAQNQIHVLFNMLIHYQNYKNPCRVSLIWLIAEKQKASLTIYTIVLSLVVCIIYYLLKYVLALSCWEHCVGTLEDAEMEG